MRKFNVGDTVKITNYWGESDAGHSRIGEVSTVTEVAGPEFTGTYPIMLANGAAFLESELELVEPAIKPVDTPYADAARALARSILTENAIGMHNIANNYSTIAEHEAADRAKGIARALEAIVDSLKSDA